jgi:signal transduction histidine kinase
MKNTYTPELAAGEKRSSWSAHRLVWALAFAGILGAAAAIFFGLSYAVASGDFSRILSHLALTPFITIAYVVLGALVSSRHPRNPIGWIFLITGLLYAGTALSGAAAASLKTIPSPTALLLSQLGEWLGIWLWMPAIALPTIYVFLLFPTGKLLSPRWKVVFWAATLGLAAAVLGASLHPGPLSATGTGPNPFGLEAYAPTLEGLLGLSMWLLVPSLLAALFSFGLRFRRSAGLERQQMKWLVYALVFLLLANLAGSVLWFLFPENSFVGEVVIAISDLTILGIAAAASIAVTRYRLYEIDLVINRTLVYGLLTLGVIAIYVVLVGGLGALFQAQGSPLIALFATGVVAVLFQPSRQHLQVRVDRLFYGKRDDPLAALAQLGDRLEAAISQEMVLPTLVETLAQTLKLPYAAIKLRTGSGFTPAAQTGQETPSQVELELVYRGEIIGQLIAGKRAPGEDFSPADMRLLETIAYQAGPAVHAVQLTVELQQARLELVSAREEERRRLRRDLHDGLGATLAALNLEAGALRRMIRTQPEQAEARAEEMRVAIRQTIDDIRRLVYELRPPTLDQLGLAAAVRALASQASRSAAGRDESASLQVTVDAPDELPPLPAAIEAAAYRIVQEALTNVVRHSGAQNCFIRLALDEKALTVEISDSGRGVPVGQHHGVGFASMRERAVELGGTLQVSSLPAGGTQIIAFLPVSAPGDTKEKV